MKYAKEKKRKKDRIVFTKLLYADVRTGFELQENMKRRSQPQTKRPCLV